MIAAEFEAYHGERWAKGGNPSYVRTPCTHCDMHIHTQRQDGGNNVLIGTFFFFLEEEEERA